MDYWSNEQRRVLREKLQKRALALRAEIEEALRKADTDEAMHLANHIEEIDDQAVADLETSLDIAALERDVQELRAVEAALRHLDSADFGRCPDCGEAIPYARLMAEPTATRCVGCQAAVESPRARTL